MKRVAINESKTPSSGCDDIQSDCVERFSPVAQRLIHWFDSHREVAIAFSGGVDSSVVLAAALHSVAERVVAVTARSESVASWQIDLAIQLAEHLGAEHHFVETNELQLEDYTRNDSGRCFHCKSTLYEALSAMTIHGGFQGATIVSGTNADDLGDHRPGILAGDQAGVRKPLAELNLDKVAVRALAAEFGLPNRDLPASPCLASRLAYGVSVTPERLQMVDQAEAYLRELGFVEFRVRMHESLLARIEVTEDQLSRLMGRELRSSVTSRLKKIGFRFVAIDLEGFQSGKMNRQLVSIQTGRPTPCAESTLPDDRSSAPESQHVSSSELS